MKRPFLVALAAVLASGVFADTTQLLGGGAGNVRAVNALSEVGLSELEMQWSRRDFQDATTGMVFGFWPSYTISNTIDDPFGWGWFDFPNDPVTITTVDSLVSRGWPATFQAPNYLFRQGGVYSNRSANGDHSVLGPTWIKYDLAPNANGWAVHQVKIFAWDIRDIVHKASATKTTPFSDTGTPQTIQVYVASDDPNMANDPNGDANWTLVGTLSKANGTIPNACEWNPGTNNTFGECSAALLDHLTNTQFWLDPTNDRYYSIVDLTAMAVRGVKHVALRFPHGNQYGADATLAASNRTSSSLRFTNYTDVVVIGGSRVLGDIDGNGCVDDTDLARVLTAFGAVCVDCPEDINKDGIIDDTDLAIVLTQFGAGC